MTPFERKVVHDAVAPGRRACPARARARSRAARSWSSAVPDAADRRPRVRSAGSGLSPDRVRPVFGDRLAAGPALRRAPGQPRRRARADRSAGGPAAVGSPRAELRGRRRAGPARRPGRRRRVRARGCPGYRWRWPVRTSRSFCWSRWPAGSSGSRGGRRSRPGRRGGAGSGRGDRGPAALGGCRRGDRSRRRAAGPAGRLEPAAAAAGWAAARREGRRAPRPRSSGTRRRSARLGGGAPRIERCGVGVVDPPGTVVVVERVAVGRSGDRPRERGAGGVDVHVTPDEIVGARAGVHRFT